MGNREKKWELKRKKIRANKGDKERKRKRNREKGR